MRTLRQVAYLVRSAFRKRAMNAELAEEIRYHVERETEEAMRRGMPAAEARRQALAAFGGTTYYAGEAAEARGWRWFTDIATDTRHAARLVRRNPVFSLCTTLIVAFGIGVTTLVFSAVNGVMLRPFPFHDIDHLAIVIFRQADGTPAEADADTYAALDRSAPPFAAIGGYSLASGVMIGSGEPTDVNIERVTQPLLATLGVTPLMGRLFSAEECVVDEPVALLSHAFWQEHFASDSTVIGRSFRLDSTVYTVVGVMPAGFRGPMLRNPDLWLPNRLSPALQLGARTVRPSLIVRLRPGITPAAAESWLNSNLHVQGSSFVSSETASARASLTPLTEFIYGDVRRPLEVLLGAVLLVLVLVASNVATLLLARASARTREFAIRRALGAGRARQVRQLLTETFCLVLFGGAIGIAGAWWGIRIFNTTGDDILPRAQEIALDPRVLAFALLVTIITGLAAGALPALAASQSSLVSSIKGAAGGWRWRDRHWGGVRGLFVMVQVALSVMLLVGAGLLVKGFLRVAPTAPGFTIAHRVTLSLVMRDGGRIDDAAAAARWSLAREGMRRVSALPHVNEVAVISTPPLVRASSLRDVTPDHTDGTSAPPPVRSHQRSISPNYFTVMGLTLVSGRSLAFTDDAGGEPVAVINQTAAKRWWPGQNPLGHTFTFRAGRRGLVTMRVVGVIRDARSFGTDTRMRPEFFVPFAQSPTQTLTFIVNTADAPSSIAHALKEQVWAIDPALPVDEVTSMEAIAGASVREARFYSALLLVFATVALVVAVAGMFGVLTQLVQRRRKEIGIRLALGAPRRQIGTDVLGQSARITAWGLVLGTIGALALTRYMTSLLMEVSARDTQVFLVVIVLVSVVAMAVSMFPLRRALSIDPLETLRVD